MADIEGIFHLSELVDIDSSFIYVGHLWMTQALGGDGLYGWVNVMNFKLVRTYATSTFILGI